jgi:hypothetical protein
MRNVGMNGPLPITIDQLLSYCIMTGIRSSDDRDALLHFITLLDSIWLKNYYDKAEKTKEKAQARKASTQR